MVFDRPKPSKQNPVSRPPQTPQKATTPKKVITSSGGGSGSGSGNNNNPPPSPWLDEQNEPEPHPNASFVEYLRWMRPPNHPQKDATKVQILHEATEKANYRDRLQQLNQRTQLIAGKNNTFQVKSSWRIRVGGHRGPESILLPAFDTLGIPYIPSSTLRGVARNQAIRDFMAKETLTWEDAEKKISPYFGSLEAENQDKAGKIIFLDAYPVPNQLPSGGLTMDMANNIWNWQENGSPPKYAPNPNPFLSLKEPTFLIGLRLASTCNDPQILEKVKTWLIEGLQAGIGSQVNTGYGSLIKAGVGQPKEKGEFFRVDFSLEGQLIHGHQRFTQWNFNDKRQEWQMRGQPVPEVRPIAFKSMLRYWFRVLALGVLEDPQTWEGKLFGAINPNPSWGWVKVNIMDGKVTQKEPRPNSQGKNDPCGTQQGTLILSLTPSIDKSKENDVQKLCQSLVWLMFNMGGIGQGARRPSYSRQERDAAPWFRGSTFYIDSEDKLWDAPDTVGEFKKLFQKRLQDFYVSLGQLTGVKINYRSVGQVTENAWVEAVDRNCEIIVCSGAEKNNKPFALSVLHDQSLKKPGKAGTLNYDGNLCGQVVGGVKPSPVWIADLGDYQVVTVFGANVNPRKKYLEELQRRASKQNYAKVFPLL